MGVTYSTGIRNTYVPIATYTIPSAAANYTFTSIPATYTDLVLVINGATSAAANILIQYNSDTAASYSYQYLTSAGSTPTAGKALNTTQIALNDNGYFGTGNSTNITQIFNYSNTSIQKTNISKATNPAQGIAVVVGCWRSNLAINAIKIFTGSGTFSTGTTMSLYGI